jgi:ribosome-associated protein
MHTIQHELLSEGFARSSGPGGQNVNRRETKVQLRYRFGADRELSEAAKQRIRAKARPSELLDADTLFLEVSDTRHRERNREIALQRLAARIDVLRAIPKARKPTKPTRAAKAKRLDAKRHRSDTKKRRQKPRDW